MVVRLPKPAPETAYLRCCHYRVATLPCVVASTQGSFISSQSTKTDVNFTPVFWFLLRYFNLFVVSEPSIHLELYIQRLIFILMYQYLTQPSSCLCQIWYPGQVPLSGTQRSYQVLPVSFCRLCYIALAPYSSCPAL